MPLTLLPQRADLAVGVPRSFVGSGGLPPYSYRLEGKGGIDAASGIYTAPRELPRKPQDQQATIIVTDANGDEAEADVYICTPMVLLCRILQKELALPDGRVYLWDQKINSPTDLGLFIAISALNPKCYSNINRFDPATNAQLQQSSWVCQMDVDIISQGPEARDRKEEVVMSLNSQYSVQQQDLNSFSIGVIPTAIRNLSEIDGGAIPYRFNFSVNLMYTVTKNQAAEYFDTFEPSELSVDP